MATAIQEPSSADGSIPTGMKEILEYEKILKIRDQIFSGNHPRLKVPQHVIRKISPRNIQTPATPGTAQQQPHQPQQQQQQQEHVLEETAVTEKGPQYGGSPWGAPGVCSAEIPSIAAPNSGAGGTPMTATKPTSEIDPIFLTKSDDLVRAEIQLKRQRAERALQDVFKQQKLEASQKTAQQESMPDFDVSGVLQKAQEIVKPTSAGDAEAANRTIAASDSFDEASFYSSKAPDSPQFEPGQTSRTPDKQPVTANPGNGVADTHVDRHSDDAREYDPADFSATLDTQPQPYDLAPQSFRNGVARDISPAPEAINVPPAVYDEPEYSPPGPTVPPTHPRYSRDLPPQSGRNVSGRSAYRQAEPDHNNRRDYPTPNRVRVVNNHITSPAAPQPSRVSPLASRVSSLQGRQDRQSDKGSGGRDSARTSPEGPSQPLQSRKRRRVQEARDKPQYVEDRGAMESPEIPYIKPEPVSPPPFADISAPSRQSGSRVVRGPRMVETEAPQYSPVAERRQPGRFVPPYDDRYMESSAADPNIARSFSRAAYTRPTREPRDLRRIASVQNARQPEYMQDYPEAGPEPRYARAASYAVPERPPLERSRYYEEAPPPPPPPPPQPAYGRRYVSRAASPTSPQLREEYAEPAPAPARAAMPPPQRRVVVDAEGNTYYESVSAPKAAPQTSPRYARYAEYDDGPPVRPGNVRAVSVMEHPPSERRYQQEMPPPPPTAYRRAPEYSRSVAPEHRAYEWEYEPRRPMLRSGSVQVVDYPPRHAQYVDEEPHYPREEVVRMSSVQPPAAPPSRYEEPPREIRPRMQSTRPAGREMSVYVDDEPHAHHEYVPVKRTAGYGAARPVREERYYDEEGPQGMGYERGPEMVRRVSRRY